MDDSNGLSASSVQQRSQQRIYMIIAMKSRRKEEEGESTDPLIDLEVWHG